MRRNRPPQHRLFGIGLSAFVIGMLTVLGAYHVFFGFDGRDIQRYRRILETTPLQSVPQQVEADFNARFLPASAARILTLGVHTVAPVSRAAEVYESPDGYAFVLEDMRVAYGRSFMDPRETRAAEAHEVIAEFARELRERDIHLIVVPVPAKTTILPAQADPSNPFPHAPLLNKGHLEWITRLRGAGADVIDLTDTLWAHRQTDPLYYLPDTHWTQRAMHLSAKAVASRVREKIGDMSTRETFPTRTHQHSMPGDLAAHLSPTVPDIQEQILCLRNESGPIHFGPDAPVLVLGDSYAEQFESLGGGFAQLLALETGIGVQSAAKRGINASGMFHAGKDAALMERKRVVVLVFSIRKLQVNDWIVRYDPSPTPPPSPD